MTSNEAFFDALVRHQIYLSRVSGSLRNKVLALLDATEKDMERTILRRLRSSESLSSPADVRRLETLLRIIRTPRLRAWDDITKTWTEDLIQIAKAEPTTLSAIVQTVSPALIDTLQPPVPLLRSIVTSRPFEGRVLREWASTAAGDDLRRIENAVRLGMVSGESNAAIARRVVGTKSLRGADGVTAAARRNVQSITRTAVNHVSNEVSQEFFKSNSDLFDEEQFVATLDARTSAICRSLDGTTHEVGTGPVPPMHFNCRSTRVPVLDGEVLARRPAKPVTEKGLLREWAQKEGYKSTPTSRDGLRRGDKSRFDAFSRRRVRELTGRVPGRTSYQEWLGRQSAEFQDDVLGKTKGRLFRKGGLTLDKFVDRNGAEMTLAELSRRHASAFEAAGLDPLAFR